MVIFYSNNIEGGICHLDKNDSAHCVRVLRHVSGDTIHVIDGEGTLYECILEEASAKNATAKISKSYENWGSHPYELIMAVCPTKNNDRFEWFIEKSTELGIDKIVPVIGEHSERRVYKTERGMKIAISASKQSLKGKIPVIAEPESVSEFIEEIKISTSQATSTSNKTPATEKTLLLIAHCHEDGEEKIAITKALHDFDGKRVVIMIGPEGDFSKKEVEEALEAGFIPIHLGPSRLRTETAAITGAESVYLNYI